MTEQNSGEDKEPGLRTRGAAPKTRSTWALTPTAALHSSQRQATCYDGPREVEQELRREKASVGRG